MIRELPSVANPNRPLPVARLLRQSFNAKTAKDGHDTAYFAWEVSIRIAVAASPPDDASKLRVGSVGEWVRALRPGLEIVENKALQDLFAHLTREVEGKPRRGTTLRTRHLFESLAAYRNLTIGHGTLREQESFYVQGARLLREGVEAAWDLGLFLPSSSRLVYTTGVRIDSAGSARAFTLELLGEIPAAERAEGEIVTADILPSTVYQRTDTGWRSLHPWLIFDDWRERLFCFQALKRRPEYLDFSSGEFLRGDAIEILAPGTTAVLQARLGEGQLPADKPILDERDFGDFLLLGLLGEGGMGSVHLAEQRSLGRLVALKILPRESARDPSALARFRREIEALGRCEHPNVVKIFESGVERGQPYYAMEYVQGVDLRRIATHLQGRESFDDALLSAWEDLCASRSDLKGVLPDVDTSSWKGVSGESRQDAIAAILRDAALGVQCLHDEGILHRDISPANIVVTVPDRRAVVMDLGLATLEGRELSLSLERTRVFGTLRYMSPEQLEGVFPVDRRTDVYGLGTVLYELLSGAPAFEGDSHARLVDQVLRADPRPLPTRGPRRVPNDLSLICSKAIERERDLRYPTAEELAHDLSAYLEGRPISARSANFGYLLRRWAQRNKLLATTVTIGVVGILIALAIAVGQGIVAKNETQRGNLLRDLELATGLKEKAPSLPASPRDTQSARDFLRDLAALKERFGTHAEFLRTRAVVGNAVRPSPIEVSATKTAPPEAAVGGQERSRKELRDGYEKLGKILDELDAPGTGVSARIQRQSDEFDEVAKRSIADHLHEWETASDELTRDTRFPGLTLKPLMGLVPIGADPTSGLLEFWHVLSGTRPERDRETGELLKRAEMGIVFVLLPGGEFLMGAQKKDPREPNYDEDANGNESPPNRVRLDPFLISKYEVTEDQWHRLAGEYSGEQGPERVDDPEEERMMGVHGLERDQARELLARFLLGLPSEAQWEYASRAGSDSHWFFGNEVSKLGEYGNIADKTFHEKNGLTGYVWTEHVNDGAVKPTPVGLYCPNRFGLHDTIGNVLEWVDDDYSDTAYGTPPIDGRGFRGIETKTGILRGGQWAAPAIFSRSSHRYPVQANCEGNAGVRPVYPLHLESFGY